MSEEKLYAVKNDEGKYLLMDSTPLWGYKEGSFVKNSALALAWADDQGGNVVTLIEEPKKVVLSKEQAEIVEGADKANFPASYIAQHTGNSGCLEKLLMNAYVNGYTVAKEKKYNVKVPHAVNSCFKKIDANHCVAGDTFIFDLDEHLAQFTEAEIEQYGLQDCEKVWCDSDD